MKNKLLIYMLIFLLGLVACNSKPKEPDVGLLMRNLKSKFTNNHFDITSSNNPSFEGHPEYRTLPVVIKGKGRWKNFKQILDKIAECCFENSSGTSFKFDGFDENLEFLDFRSLPSISFIFSSNYNWRKGPKGYPAALSIVNDKIDKVYSVKGIKIKSIELIYDSEIKFHVSSPKLKTFSKLNKQFETVQNPSIFIHEIISKQLGSRTDYGCKFSVTHRERWPYRQIYGKLVDKLIIFFSKGKIKFSRIILHPPVRNEHDVEIQFDIFAFVTPKQKKLLYPYMYKFLTFDKIKVLQWPYFLHDCPASVVATYSKHDYSQENLLRFKAHFPK